MRATMRDVMQVKKLHSRAQTALVRAFILFIALGLFMSFLPLKAFAWGNGDSTITSAFRKNSVPLSSVNIHDAQHFTLNFTESQSVSGPGWGLSQHDFVLEQALAVAINSGADISWVDLPTAQRATADPDYSGTLARSNYLYGGEYHSYSWGSAPRDCEAIYTRMVADIAAGRTISASQKLGWLAHYYSDLSSPLHVASSRQMSVIPSGERSVFHYLLEEEVGWYMCRVVEHESSKWSTQTKNVMELTPSEEMTASAYTSTSPSARRASLFGSSTLPVVGPCSTGVRATAIRIAQKSRDKYAGQAISAWALRWQSGANYSVPQLLSGDTSRSEAVGKLLDLSPKMNALSANALASVVVAASNRSSLSGGLDPAMRISLTGATKDQTYTYKKKKTRANVIVIRVRTTQKKPVEAMRVKIVWKNAKGKTLSSRLLITPSSGNIYLKVPDAARKHKGKVIATASLVSASRCASVKLPTNFYAKRTVAHKTKTYTSKTSSFSSLAKTAQ